MDPEEFVRSKRSEIDAAYEQMTRTVAEAYFQPTGLAPVRLTMRQRFNVYTWRVRGWLARPFVWLLKVLDPSALSEDE